MTEKSDRTLDALDLPLAGIRVVDMSDGKGEMCGRFLADLGAEVILVEPPQGAASRKMRPTFKGVSLYFATHNANKRSVVLDLEIEEDRNTFKKLINSADIFIETTRPGTLDKLGLSVTSLRQQNPALVAISITDFGQTGPYRDHVATNAVHMAIGGVLARSGIEGREPLLPPASLAYETTAIQAAWCVLLAYWQRLCTGRGDHLDFSVLDATTQILDPMFGVVGGAKAGLTSYEMIPRGRPAKSKLYPIFPCADGMVRVCILNPGQWYGMSEWLGGDHEFSDPAYGNIFKRVAVIDKINALIAELFIDKPGEELVSDGKKYGVPIATVDLPSDVLNNEHFIAREAFTDLEIAPGIVGKLPSGYVDIDSVRAGIRKPAPIQGEFNKALFADLNTQQIADSVPVNVVEGRRPFEGIRILDLGIIVAGAEASRLFADQGAEVIKVENKNYPDGLRQPAVDGLFPQIFAQCQRGKLSLGLNLRTKTGKELLQKLIAQCDIVMSNFKPGTLESLGLGYETFKAINPRIIALDSSALGSTGPWSRTMGYGPLVRATSGLTSLWSYPDIEDGFSDSITILPDHYYGRVGATSTLAQLIRCLRTGTGGTASVSHAEIVLNAMSEHFLRESLDPGTFKPWGNQSEYDAPYGVFPCAGDDEWCVIEVRHSEDWKNLCTAIGQKKLADDKRFATPDGRLQYREELESIVTSWTRMKSPYEVLDILQAAKVPAGNMQRLTEYLSNPQFKERNLFRQLHQTGLPEPLLTENAPVLSEGLPDPEIRSSPLLCEHTREIAERLLGLSGDALEAKIEQGDLMVADGSNDN